MREFHEFLPPIRREARNRETQDLPVHNGIKAEVGFPNRLINRLDVDRSQTWTEIIRGSGTETVAT